MNKTLQKLLSRFFMFNMPMLGIVDGEGGGGGLSDEEVAAAAALAAAEAAALAEAEAAALALANGGTKPTDAEAKLLKDVMKQKDAAKALKAQLDQATARLKDFDGIDPAKHRELKAAADAKALQEAEARGEYDRLVKQMGETHTAEIARVRAEGEGHAARESTLQAQIAELTVGNSFTGSEFVKKTTLTPAKARVIYGAHFEFIDGKVVGFDKPAGAKERTQLVDAAGNVRGFEDALRVIVEADDDRDSILLSGVKPGAGSGTVKAKPIVQDPNTPSLRSRRSPQASLCGKRSNAIESVTADSPLLVAVTAD